MEVVVFVVVLLVFRPWMLVTLLAYGVLAVPRE